MRILLLATMMIFASSTFAGLYKWIDDEGNVHYSQKRPANQQFKRLKAPPPAPENSKSLYQPSAQTSKASNTVEKETAKNEKIRTENCAKAKKNLSNYQIHRRVRDKDGNVKTINDNERANQIKNAQQAINNYCN